MLVYQYLHCPSAPTSSTLTMNCPSQIAQAHPDQREQLNFPITDLEIKQAIKYSANNKTPGPDDYPSDFFKFLSEEISGSLNITPHIHNSVKHTLS